MKIYLCGRIVFWQLFSKQYLPNVLRKFLSNVIYTGIHLNFVGYKYATFYFYIDILAVLSNFISYNRRLHSGAGTQWTEDDHELRDFRHTGSGRRHVFHLLHPPADHVPKSDHVVARHLSQPLCPFWFPCRLSQTCCMDCLIFYRYEAHIIESGCKIVVHSACIYNFFFFYNFWLFWFRSSCYWIWL